MGKSKKKAKSKSAKKVKSLASKAKKKKSWGAKETKGKERLRRALLIPEDVQEQILNDLPKMKYITSTQLSIKYGIKISVIKPFLKELEEKNRINLVLTNSRIKIYVHGTKKEAEAAS
ncbi:MAG: hypothetical protein HWN67_23165 [Candidatus Helarchaeota archaeon]|nr:hypothetical protein [Candidatus Helarchaeota archaeon]